MSKQTELAQVADTITVDSGNVGIGVVPETWNSANNGLQVGPRAAIFGTDSGYSGFSNNQYQATDGSAKYIVTAPAAIINLDPDSTIKFRRAASGTADTAISWSEAMRLDASGNLLVGKTSANTSTVGVEALSNGEMNATVNGGRVISLDRLGSDGDIVRLRKSSSTVGVIGTLSGDFFIASSVSSGSGLLLDANTLRPMRNGALADNIIDLGGASQRFDDIYATNSTIQTSDQNEKQQIASLTTAEMDAAKAISQLFKTFKWNDSVSEKGDAARTHAGVIAQEVEAAMTDAGLDAGDYAFFISSTWWETQTDVPAVAAVAEVLDDDGNVVTEAVEAKDAYTRTDTYETLAEAPAGATERNRKGIRYPELLSFVGAATEQRLADIETRLTALEAV